MLREFKADLHIHTCLSPCADNEMTPKKIIKYAKMKNLDMVGICDHNSAENVKVTREIGRREQIIVVGGIEAASQEEVHVLALFEYEKELLELQSVIYGKLSGTNDERSFGKQLVVDQDDEVIGSNGRLLIGATSLSLQKIVRMIHSLGGLAIASHVDRERYSVIGQLGYIPEGLSLDALEISSNYESRVSDYEQYGYPLVGFSDAHFLRDIGKRHTSFVMEEASIGEIRKALAGEDSREIVSG